MKTINSKQDLINYFEKGCKEENQVSIGVEHEKFIFENFTKKRVNFKTISKVFNFLEQFGWKPIKERDYVIGLSREGQSITLEPGNQIELSGKKLNSIHLNCTESYKYLDELKKACKKLNLKMMSVSFDPFTKLENAPSTPKQRYEIMTKEMPKAGGKLSLDMMYQTCGTQINLDYISEKDFIKKFKLSSFLTPISIAIFANSSIIENRLSGYLSYRSKVWQNTSRAGLPEVFFENMDFEKYSDFTMTFPILFIEKDKKYIELRSMDACGWDCLCAGPAFNTGILYGNLDEALDLVSKWDKNKIINAYLEVPKKGFNTQLMGKDLFYWSKIFLNLSKKGLENRDIINKSNKNETKFLNHLEKIIDNKITNADHMIDKFSKSENLKDLYDK